MRKHRPLIAIAITAGVVLLVPTTASAGSAQPDAWIKKPGAPYKGDDVINLSGDGQRVRTVAASGITAKFTFRVENDGIDAGTIFLKGTGSDANFKVRYKNNDGTNFTPGIVAGTTMPFLEAGGGTVPFKILITPKPAAPLGAIKTVKVTARHGATTERDRVKAIVENGLPGE
jgi:hypothetical protein